jgi:hypothetical protein
MMRSQAIVALSVLVMLGATPASAADRPLRLSIDGRPASRDTTVAKMRGDIAYADLVVLVRVFGGLVSIRGTGMTATVGAHSALFHTNDTKAKIDGTDMTMSSAAFKEDGDLYVPLAFFVKNVVPGTTLRIDRANGLAALHSRPQPSPSP